MVKDKYQDQDLLHSQGLILLLELGLDLIRNNLTTIALFTVITVTGRVTLTLLITNCMDILLIGKVKGETMLVLFQLILQDSTMLLDCLCIIRMPQHGIVKEQLMILVPLRFQLLDLLVSPLINSSNFILISLHSSTCNSCN